MHDALAVSFLESLTGVSAKYRRSIQMHRLRQTVTIKSDSNVLTASLAKVGD